MEEIKKNDDKILSAQNVHTTFRTHGKSVKAVRGVSFYAGYQEILAGVGESGSGKSVLMKSILGLMPENAEVTADQILFMDKNILEMTPEQQRKMRGKEIAMVFQDPMTALNPLRTIGFHLTEVLKRHRGMDKRTARKEAIAVLEQVGISSPEKRLDQYPHEFSGGMRQRVLIAMALCCRTFDGRGAYRRNFLFAKASLYQSSSSGNPQTSGRGPETTGANPGNGTVLNRSSGWLSVCRAV